MDTWGGGGGRDTYMVSFTCVLTSVVYPVEGYPEKACTTVRIRENFMYRHWKDQV